MKLYNFILLFILALIWACQPKETTIDCLDHTDVSLEERDTIRKSIPKNAAGKVGQTAITLKYHAPAVRERVIWGGLVPYGDVWVTGAHSATQIDFSNDVTINGTNIPKGKYALFTIPGKNTWEVIINKNWEQHLADRYDQKEDVIRITVSPATNHHFVERLTYCIQEKGQHEGSVLMHWEKLFLSFDFTVSKE